MLKSNQGVWIDSSSKATHNHWLFQVIAGRLLYGAAVFLGVFTLSFALSELAPGDYFDSLRLDPNYSSGTIESLKLRHGQDNSAVARYIVRLKGLVLGDFGVSLSYQQPVLDLLLPRAKNTLLLSVPAMCMAWLAAILFGIVAAATQWSWARSLIETTTSALLAIPDLLLALAFLILALRTGWFPTGGIVSHDFSDMSGPAKSLDVLAHCFVPLTALVLSIAPVLVRHVQDSMQATLGSPMIRATRLIGLPRLRLLFLHALPAAANPLITLLGLSIGALLSVSLLIEVIVGWPGMGPLLLEAILSRDVDLVMGSLLFSTLMLIIGTMVADVMQVVADPRRRRL